MTDFSNISVGDILYLVSNKQRQVLPLRVVEQVHRKTLEGETTTYLVNLLNVEKTVELSTLQTTGEIFLSLEDVREYLREKALKAIDEVISDAEKIAMEIFQVSKNLEDQPDLEDEEHSSSAFIPDRPSVPAKVYKRPAAQKNDEDKVTVTLPDGSRAKLVSPGV